MAEFFGDYIFRFENESDHALTKKWQAIAWTNGHLDYRRIHVSPGFDELIHSGLMPHIFQWIRQSMAYFTKEVNPGLAKLPLTLNGCFAKHG